MWRWIWLSTVYNSSELENENDFDRTSFCRHFHIQVELKTFLYLTVDLRIQLHRVRPTTRYVFRMKLPDHVVMNNSVIITYL